VTAVEPIETRVGHTGADELRFRGHRVFGELLGHVTVGQMLILGATGRLLDPDDIAIVDDIVVAMSSADPRLWPFKVTRLGTTFGTAGYGVAATLVSAEGGMYGPGRLFASASWLVALDREITEAPSDEVIAKALDRGGHGFGVLYRTRDERYEALMRQVELRRRHELRFARLCRETVRVARSTKNLEPHVFFAIAALGLDLGLSPHAVTTLATIVLFHDAMPNALEGALQRPVSLQRLPASVVEYRGEAARRSPRLAGL
jgi:hypothetical protein